MPGRVAKVTRLRVLILISALVRVAALLSATAAAPTLLAALWLSSRRRSGAVHGNVSASRVSAAALPVVLTSALPARCPQIPRHRKHKQNR